MVMGALMLPEQVPVNVNVLVSVLANVPGFPISAVKPVQPEEAPGVNVMLLSAPGEPFCNANVMPLVPIEYSFTNSEPPVWEHVFGVVNTPNANNAAMTMTMTTRAQP